MAQLTQLELLPVLKQLVLVSAKDDLNMAAWEAALREPDKDALHTAIAVMTRLIISRWIVTSTIFWKVVALMIVALSTTSPSTVVVVPCKFLLSQR